MKIHKFFIGFLIASILFCGLSVSLSQLFLYLSFLLFLFDQRKYKFVITPIGKAAFLLFLFYIASFCYRWITFGFSSDYASRAWHGELKDIGLFAGFIVMQALQKEDMNKIQKAFFGLIAILLITGLISVFTPIRLNHILNDFLFHKTGPGWKFTHHYGSFAGINLYLPIGLMNTHLTFGGLLLLFTPVIFFRLLRSIQSKIFSKQTFFSFLLFAVFFFVFFLNNARSSLFGAAAGVIFGISYEIFQLHRISRKTVLLSIAGMIILIGLASAFLFKIEATRKIVAPLLGEKKHTDSGRSFIWHSTFPLIAEHPITGIGPGQYNIEIEKQRLHLAEQEPELLYFYETTQRGHAHNDFFHITAVFGIPALLAFLYLAFSIGSTILNTRFFENRITLFFGLVGFFFAGTYQCYFQDDEVVIVFWLLAGFLSRFATGMAEKTESIQK